MDEDVGESGGENQSLLREEKAGRGPRRLDTRRQLVEFFAECGARESGEEPDWPAHRAMIEASRRSRTVHS